MHILLDTPRWLYSPKNTDWRMKLSLAKGLESEGVALPRGLLFSLVYNFDMLASRFVPVRWRSYWHRNLSRVKAWLLGFERPDVVVSQGCYPPCSRKFRTIWETYFLPPEHCDKPGSFVRGGSNLWIRQMEEYGEIVARIGVRGAASVNLLKEMYPEYASKVLDLPFLTEEFDIATEDSVNEKQSSSGLVEILFVGREAKRKGLDIALSALYLLRNGGINNFHFTIVSNLHDGSIDIPHEEWISHIREIPHPIVMGLFKKAHIFIMPSRFESYGLVYQEAMASGCVTVVRDEDPQREFVDNGLAGICVDERSPTDIADKLKLLIKDSVLRRTIALAGLRRYRKCFSLEVRRAKWKECIHSLGME